MTSVASIALSAWVALSERAIGASVIEGDSLGADCLDLLASESGEANKIVA